MQSIKCQAEALKEPVDDFKYSAGVFLPCLYSAGQLTRSPAEHNGCTVSPQSWEGARPCDRRDRGFQQASTSCSKCGGWVFLTNPCVFCMWNLPSCPWLAHFPTPPCHSASNAAFICRLAEAHCPPHSVSLISVNPVPGQNKLCLPEHIWEGWQGWEAAWQSNGQRGFMG